MPGAQKLRLIEALDDFIRSYAGDGGSAPRSAQAGTGADLVTEAQALRDKLDQGSGDESDSPGGRASKRGSEQGGGFGAAADRAREMFKGS